MKRLHGGAPPYPVVRRVHAPTLPTLQHSAATHHPFRLVSRRSNFTPVQRPRSAPSVESRARTTAATAGPSPLQPTTMQAAVPAASSLAPAAAASHGPRGGRKGGSTHAAAMRQGTTGSKSESGTKKSKKKGRQSAEELSPAEQTEREEALLAEQRKQLLDRLTKMKWASQLPDYFKRIHYSSDAEMVDGYKLVELFTHHNAAGHDIRHLHTIFCTVVTVELAVMLLLLEERRPRRTGTVPPGFDPATGRPTKDVFTRLEKLEGPLNDPAHQKAFFVRPRHVVVLQAMTPKVVRNAWEAPVDLDVRPYAKAAQERLVETATAVALSRTVFCPLCGIPPPCSHRHGAFWLRDALNNRKAYQRATVAADSTAATSAKTTAAAVDTGGSSEPSATVTREDVAGGAIAKQSRWVKAAPREPMEPWWVAQIKHAYENKPSTWAIRKKRAARQLKRDGPVRVDCNRKLDVDPNRRWVPPDYRDHPLFRPAPAFALTRHLERYDGSLAEGRARKYNYNHVLHNHDAQFPGGVPSTTARCANCTLPLDAKAVAAAAAVRGRGGGHQLRCERCVAARPSLAVARGLRREDAATLLKDYYIEQCLRPPQ